MESADLQSDNTAAKLLDIFSHLRLPQLEEILFSFPVNPFLNGPVDTNTFKACNKIFSSAQFPNLKTVTLKVVIDLDTLEDNDEGSPSEAAAEIIPMLITNPLDGILPVPANYSRLDPGDASYLPDAVALVVEATIKNAFEDLCSRSIQLRVDVEFA